jgi:D-alanyl-D-alanine carboxypeptidase
MFKNKILQITLIGLVGIMPSLAFAAGPVPLISDLINPTIKAQSYVILDAVSGKQLSAQNENAPWPPASMTKLLTSLVVLDNNPKLAGNVIITKADKMPGSNVAFSVGQKIACKDLIYASLVPSGNNATNALVRCSGLSREDFINRMNVKAQSLGARQSVFVEPTGYSEINTTSAEDYSKVIREAFNNPMIQKVTTTKSYSFRTLNKPSKLFTVKNTNSLLNDSDVVVLGGKTGFINESGYNLSTRLSLNGLQSVDIVVMGAESRADDFSITKDLAKWSWFNFAWDSIKTLSTN